MLTLPQTARYLTLQSTCLINNNPEQTAIVTLNARTCEASACTALPAIHHTTESYILWVLSLPLAMPHHEQLEIARAIAVTCVNARHSLLSQREAIQPNTD